MKTIAQQLNIKEFPFKINDNKGNEIYYEDSDGGIIDNRKVESQFNKLPKQVNEILYSADDSEDIYQESIRIKAELKQIGWSVDYDLAGEIHLLIKD